MRLPTIFATLAVIPLLGSLESDARAAGTVNVLVLREHSVVNAIQAQPYVDRFISLAAKHNGWTDAKGQFHATRSGADAYIQASKPGYGILSLSAFLAMRSKYGLDVVGQVEMLRAGGQEYHFISKTATDLAGCKGKPLASNHADDATFVDQVVSGGAFKLSEFTLVGTQRPVQTIKKVASGEVACALVDDAQYEELGHIDAAAGIKSVWKSARLPSMVVVAFPSVSASERQGFQASLPKICTGDGKNACAEVGMTALKSATAADYSGVVAAYGK